MDRNKGTHVMHFPASGRINQGSLKHFITILTRVESGTSLDNPDPSEIFTPLYSTMGRVELISPAKRFDGINTENDITNAIILMNYDPAVYQMDNGSLFIDFENTQLSGDQNRRYKCLKAENYMEESRFLRIWCMEGGFSAKQAAGI